MLAFCATAFIGISVASGGADRNTDETTSPAETIDLDNGRYDSRPTVGHPTFMSPHSAPIAIHGDHIYVENTPSATVDVISRGSRKVEARINVGIDPVSVAVRPNGK